MSRVRAQEQQGQSNTEHRRGGAGRDSVGGGGSTLGSTHTTLERHRKPTPLLHKRQTGRLKADRGQPGHGADVGRRKGKVSEGLLEKILGTGQSIGGCLGPTER